ncbi:MAG: HlyD family secretion protein [bacterium]
MKKVVTGLAIVFVVAIAFGGYYYNAYYYQHYPKVRVGLARRRDFQTTISSSGEIRLKKPHNIKAKVGGVVDEVFVKESERVARGQVLIRMDASRKELEIKDTQIKLLQAEKALDELMLGSQAEEYLRMENQLKREELNLKKLQGEYESNLELFKSNLVSRSVLEDSKRQYEIQLGNYELAKKQFEQAKGRRIPKEISIARENIEKLKISLDILNRDVENMVVRSPVDGTIIDVNVEEGDVVSEGRTLVTLADLRDIEVLANVDVSDIRGIRTGQPVRITTSIYPDVEFTGHTSSVGAVAEVVDNIRSVEVRVEFDEYDERLKPGIPVKVEIFTGQKALALTVPLEAIYRLPPEGKDNPEFTFFDRNSELEEYVFVVEQPENILTDLDEKDIQRLIRDDVFIVRKVRVNTGEVNSDEVEIKDVLEDGTETQLKHFDRVVVYNDRPLRDYDKVIVLDRDEALIFVPK